MKIPIQKINIINTEVEVNIDPNMYVFIVKYTRHDGSEYVLKLISSSKDIYIHRPSDAKDFEIVKWFIYVLNTEKEGWEFDPNYNGQAI